MREELSTVETIFHAAAALAAGGPRAAYLARACGDDGALRAEVESLLAAHETAGEFLQHGAIIDHDVDPRVEPAEDANHWPRLAGFTLRRFLGAGSGGTVFEALDENLQRAVAVKFLRAGPKPEPRERILAEARRAAALSDPAIVTIHAVTDDAAAPAIVMELVDGTRIDAATAALSFAQRAEILREVSRALAHAHARGLIHRDLKPANILVTASMKPKVLDFGLALAADDNVAERSGDFAGTPLFASPEQASGQPLTTASDIFSFGSVMFSVLTGQTPFAGKTMAEVLAAVRTTSPPFLRDVAVGVPEDLQAICLACLSFDAKDRPTAAQLVVELGRFLAGEPVRLRPALYGDILRQRLSWHAQEIAGWKNQGLISSDESDRLEAVHRRILADEDHWIVDARRVTLAQTLLYTSTWVVVVMAFLLVWLVRDDLSPTWRWLCPLIATDSLVAVGFLAERRRETLSCAAFLAAGVLSLPPTIASVLGELHLFTRAPDGVTQLFSGVFTNDQVLAALVGALALSTVALARLRMTGFAWTTAALGVASYLGVLLLFDWLGANPETRALWCLPLVCAEGVALSCERRGRIRWAMPFHVVALVSLVAALDIIAAAGPTLQMIGIDAQFAAYFSAERSAPLSFALNGVLFFAVALATERARSLDLRRISRVLEILAVPHVLVALYVNASDQRGAVDVLVDVSLYLGAAIALLIMGPWRSRWRLLLGALGGLAFGCHLLIDLGLVAKKPFVLILGGIGLVVAIATYIHLLTVPRRNARDANSTS